jgi:DNA repair protein RecO (recombination protein O)
VGVVGKGVRRASGRTGTGLDTFVKGRLTVQVKESRELQSFREFSPETARRSLGADVLRFSGASILAEIVLENAGSDPNVELFERLDQGLARLENAGAKDLLTRVLIEGWGIVGALGYAPQLDPCVHCESELGPSDIGRFDLAAGGVRCPRCAAEIGGPLVGPGAREQLEMLFLGRVPEPLKKPRAQLQLLSDFVTYHVSNGRPLQSFTFLASLLAGEGSEREGV